MKPVQISHARDKRSRQCGSSARGCTRTLKEIKEAVTKNKDEILSSNMETFDEDEGEEEKTEERQTKEKENAPQIRRNQTAK